MFYIHNKIIPFGGFTAITIWPCIFYKEDTLSKETKNHEDIHGKQQKELLLIFFYIIYLIEWILKGYDGISFEKEAYANQEDDRYLKNRKPYAMWRKKK